MTSIAFAALGTGNLNYPPLDVATEMYTQIKIFSGKRKNPTLKKICLVIFDRPVKMVSE